MLDPSILAQIDALQNRYIRALDNGDMAGWAACFGEGSSYVCATRESVSQGLPLALMMDDNYDRIKDRVNYITQVWAGTYEDYTMRHFIHRMDCRQAGPGLYDVESNVLVAYTTARGQSELLTAGIYEDQVEIGETVRFRSKTVVIDTVATPRYIVYPL